MSVDRTGIRPGTTAAAIALVVAACHSPRAIRTVEPDAQIAAAAAQREDWRTAAERWFAVWIASGETDITACVGGGHALLELGDAESASNLLDRGLLAAPNDPNLLEWKGRALVKLGFRRAAEEYFQRALAADPKRSAVRLALGQLRMDLGLEMSAVEPLRRYISETGGDYASFVLLARALRASNDANGAFENWRKAFEIGPCKPEDLLTAASLALDEPFRVLHPEVVAACRSWLEQAVAIEPQCTNAHFELGVLSEVSKDYDQAIAHYRRAIETDPACLVSLRNLAILYSGRGDEAGTREMVKRALELEKDAERRRALQRLLEPFEAKTHGEQ